jgi:hypothetical protein
MQDGAEIRPDTGAKQDDEGIEHQQYLCWLTSAMRQSRFFCRPISSSMVKRFDARICASASWYLASIAASGRSWSLAHREQSHNRHPPRLPWL